MRQYFLTLFSKPVTSLVVPAVAIVLTAYIGYSIAQPGAAYLSLFVALVAIIAGTIVAIAPNGVHVGIVLWVIAFVLGYRTLLVSPNLEIHPLMVILVGLFVVTLLRISLFEQGSIGQAIPWRASPLLMAFSAFWLFGWVVGILTNQPIDGMISESQNYFAVFPLFVIISYALQKPVFWKTITTTFFVVGVIIALVGIVEYVVPAVHNLIPAYTNASDYDYTDPFGFNRAHFAIWGNPIATFITGLALPMAIPLWTWFRSSVVRGLVVAGTGISIVGIFIGGFRSLWLAFAIMLVVVVYRQRGWLSALLVFLVMVIMFQFLPNESQQRFQSLILAFQGNFQDSSSQNRWERITDGLQQVGNNPFGSGWSSAGWIHSDFLQAAVTMGVAAAIIFIAWYLVTLLKCWKLVTRFPNDPMLSALLASFVLVGVTLVAEGGTRIPQMSLPVWFVWALATVKIQQKNNEQELRDGQPSP